MRITDSAIITDFLSNINRSKSRINKLNAQLYTRTRIQRVSEDPVTASSILRLNEDLDKVASYKSNVVDGQSFLKMTADSLGKVSDLLGEAKTVLTGAVSSGDPTLLTTLAGKMDEFVTRGMDYANTQLGSKFLFGGTQTTAPPFVRTGTPTQVTYQGDARSIQYQVGNGVTQVVNITGAAAFTSTAQIDLNGVLDRNAAINTVVNQTIQITDGAGVAHDVVLTMQKTNANSWALSAALPPGTTDASLSGGTATVTFDPVTGQMKDMVRGTALVLSPAGVTPGQTAPAVNLIYSSGGVTEGPMIPASALSTLGGTQRNVSVFNKLMEISKNLKNGVKPTAEDMTMLSMMQDVVMREEAKAGAYASNMTAADDYLTMQDEHLQSLLAAKQVIDEDTGLAEIAMKLKQEQLMLDAALSAAASIIPKSLLNFLK
jgi:flagellar hook-associated protein 3